MAALEVQKFAEKEVKAGKAPAYRGLREWLDIVESLGELKKIDGVDWKTDCPGKQGISACCPLR